MHQEQSVHYVSRVVSCHDVKRQGIEQREREKGEGREREGERSGRTDGHGMDIRWRVSRTHIRGIGGHSRLPPALSVHSFYCLCVCFVDAWGMGCVSRWSEQLKAHMMPGRRTTGLSGTPSVQSLMDGLMDVEWKSAPLLLPFLAGSRDEGQDGRRAVFPALLFL